MGARGGYAPKDFEITSNFNTNKKGGMSTRDLKKLEREARAEKTRLESERKRNERTYLSLTAKANAVKSKLGDGDVKDEIEVVSDVPPPIPPDQNDIDDRSANQMLQDLRYAYKNAVGLDGKKGRSRLMELMKSDSEFKFAMKELIKVEVGLMTAKLRAKEDGSALANQMVFVVLKGLEEEKKIMSKLDMGDGAIDMKQISAAINPDGSEYEVDKW
jgi:hypothetical protein